MASIVYIVQTSDGVTVNVTHTVQISDADLTRFLNALAASYQGSDLSPKGYLLSWIQGEMARASQQVQAHEQSLQAVPTPISFTST